MRDFWLRGLLYFTLALVLVSPSSLYADHHGQSDHADYPRVYDSYPMVWNWWRHGALLLTGIVSMVFVGRRLHLF